MLVTGPADGIIEVGTEEGKYEGEVVGSELRVGEIVGVIGLMQNPTEKPSATSKSSICENGIQDSFSLS